MTESSTQPAPKRENVWLNIGLNVIVPSLLMSKGGKWFGMESAPLLILALAFPLGYGLYDHFTRRKTNVFSIIGFVSVLITGGVGLLKLDKDWIAVKEAAVPALFGLAVLVSLLTRHPLVKTFLYSPELFDVDKVSAALKQRGTEKQFNKLMVTCTWYLVGSFALSAVLNYVLAKHFIRSETGTPAFLEEMGKMTFWSYIVIAVPSMAVMILALLKLGKGIKQCSGYELEEVMHHQAQQKPPSTPPQKPPQPDSGP